MICKIAPDQIIGSKMKIAKSFLGRLRGYMGHKFPPYEGLLIDPCQSVHTFFMNFNIHVVCLDRFNNVTKVYENLKPRRLTFWDFKTVRILELPVHYYQQCPVRPGDKLIFEETCID